MTVEAKGLYSTITIYGYKNYTLINQKDGYLN